ncbi:histidine triad nucleotide-binding protein [bacterium]|nr:histidine triad nucleotide-binding protein [bacterium]
MAGDCIFCKIIAGEIPGRRAYEDDELVVVHDINPQAPLHVLVLPRKHIEKLTDLTSEDDALIGRMQRVAAQVVEEAGAGDFRTVFNCGEGAGQSVFHIHLHVLAGRGLGWPPG